MRKDNPYPDGIDIAAIECARTQTANLKMGDAVGHTSYPWKMEIISIEGDMAVLQIEDDEISDFIVLPISELYDLSLFRGILLCMGTEI